METSPPRDPILKTLPSVSTEQADWRRGPAGGRVGRLLGKAPGAPPAPSGPSGVLCTLLSVLALLCRNWLSHVSPRSLCVNSQTHAHTTLDSGKGSGRVRNLRHPAAACPSSWGKHFSHRPQALSTSLLRKKVLEILDPARRGVGGPPPLGSSRPKENSRGPLRTPPSPAPLRTQGAGCTTSARRSPGTLALLPVLS